MRLTVDHQMRYRFSQPQARVVQLLRMTPLDNASQTVMDWNVGVDCDARLREGRDGYGNVTTMLYLDGPIEALELIVSGEVLTEDSKGRVSGTLETLPPAFFLRSTALTAADEAVESLARSAGGGGGFDAAFSLAELVHSCVTFLPARTPKSRTAQDVLALGEGSVRDCAHALIAVCRAAGFPARFVSGHCLGGANSIARQSSHCWAEVFVSEAAGWFAFDPSAGCCPGENYVRVAFGLDASDSTPFSGTRRGGGIEELDVDVRVAMSQMQG